MKTCLTCGAAVADDASVCPDCGMELDATPAPFSPPPPPLPFTPPAPAAESGFTMEFGAESAPPAPVSAPAAPITGELNPVATPEVSAPVAPAPAGNPTGKITLKRGGSLTSESFVVSNGAIVGRFDPGSGPVDVDLALLPESSYVSRHHVEFRFDAGNGTWLVRDMGSRNGTFWRAGSQGAFSRLTGEQLLSSGDEISLGNARFEFSIQ